MMHAYVCVNNRATIEQMPDYLNCAVLRQLWQQLTSDQDVVFQISQSLSHNVVV